MIKVKMLQTGEIREVSRNVAFGLIDSGVAKVYEGREEVGAYANRQMSSETHTTSISSPKKTKSKRTYKTKNK